MTLKLKTTVKQRKHYYAAPNTKRGRTKTLKCYDTTQYVYDTKRLIGNEQNAYATNTLFISSTNLTSMEDENFLETFIDDFKQVYQKYYNLNNITIYLPSAIISGSMLKDLLDIPATYTELKLNVFSFHSPVPGVWESCSPKIKKLDICFTDGIAYPHAGTEILYGMDKLHSLKSLSISNNSPHCPDLIMPSRKLKKKIVYTIGYKIIHKNLFM